MKKASAREAWFQYGLVFEPEWAATDEDANDVKKPHDRSTWDDAKDAENDHDDIARLDTFAEFPDGPDDV